MSNLDDETDTSSEEEETDWEVRKEWLESILVKYYSGRPVVIRDFALQPGCATTQSVLSTNTNVMVHYMAAIASSQARDKCKVDLLIKRLPKDRFIRFFVTEGQFDLREIKFYTQVLPDLVEMNINRSLKDMKDKIILPVSRCYYSHYRAAGETDDSQVPPESILVLEDLINSNYESVKLSTGLKLNQAMTAVKAIACMHAHFLALKVVDGQSLPERYPFLLQTAKATDLCQQLVERGLPRLACCLKRRPGMEAVLEALLVLQPRTKDIISAGLAPEGPMAVITHNNFWSNNLLFWENGTMHCYIVNWHMVTYSRPTNDVALLLMSSVSAKLRRKYAPMLLKTYWQQLNRTCFYYGLNIDKDLGYTKYDFNKDIRKSRLLALLRCIGSVDVALDDPITEQRLIDLLEDMYKVGVLTDEAVVSTNKADS